MFRKFIFVLLFFVPSICFAQSPGSVNWKGTPHGVALTCTGSAAGFNFYRGTISGGPYVKINTTPASSCAFQDPSSGLMTNTTYFYVATAVDSVGNESAYSLEASVVTPATFPANPSAPTNNSAKNN